MKNIFILLLIILLISCNSSPKVESAPVQLILDTDIGMGFDDVGAIAMLHALADSGEVNIQGMVSSNQYELSLPVIDILNTYYGRADISLGITKNDMAVNISTNLPDKWPELLVSKYPHRLQRNNEATDAVKVYRKILAEADDRSIIICCIGFQTNLRDLLHSEDDEYSSLTGRELIKKKIKRLVVMGGSFPDGREFNFFKDAHATRAVMEQWPGEIVISGSEIGSQVITGQGVAAMETTNSPVKDTYELCVSQSDHYTGMSWDQTAVLVAVKGHEPYYEVERGICLVAPDGSNTWEKTEKGNHLRLIPKMPPTEVAKKIDDYMKHLPIR